MESPSNLRSLTQTLQLKKAQDAAVVAESTSQELQKLGQDLQRQSSAVLTTTALSITQSASREMQSAEQQIVPQIDKIRRHMSQRLDLMQEQIEPHIETLTRDVSQGLKQMQGQIDPKIDLMTLEVSQRLEKMQAQINKQLRPLDEAQMQARMEQLQGQIDKQTGPLVTALGKIKTDSEALAAMTAKSWLKPALISLCVLLSISLPAWGLIAYLANQVQGNLALIKQQEQTIQLQTQTLQNLQAQTWGVTMQQDINGQFLILPEGMKADPAWTFGSRQGVKLFKQ